MSDTDEARRFLEELCKRRTSISIVFIISLLFLLIQLPYFLVVEPGTALYTVSIMNLVGLVVFTSLGGWVLWKCHKLGP